MLLLNFSVPFELRNIRNELNSIGKKWFKFGIQLGISHSVVNKFVKDNDPLSAVIDYRLLNGKVPLSWKLIVVALRTNHVDEARLARKISKKYCPEEEAVEEKG